MSDAVRPSSLLITSDPADASAKSGGYCRLRMPFSLALAARRTVAGHGGGGGGTSAAPSTASLRSQVTIQDGKAAGRREGLCPRLLALCGAARSVSGKQVKPTTRLLAVNTSFTLMIALAVASFAVGFLSADIISAYRGSLFRTSTLVKVCPGDVPGRPYPAGGGGGGRAPPPSPPLPMFEADSQTFASAPSVPRGFTLQNFRPAFGGDHRGTPGGGGGPSQTPLQTPPPSGPPFSYFPAPLSPGPRRRRGGI